MTPPQLTFHSRPAERLDRLAQEIERLVDSHESGATRQRWVTVQMAPLLERSIGVLAAVAAEIGPDQPEGRRVLATRDLVAAHLRAAADIEAADVRPEILTNLLVRAGSQLVERVGSTRSAEISRVAHP